MRLVAAASLFFVLTACGAPQYVLNIDATPPGAFLAHHNGTRLGESPSHAVFLAEPRFMSNGCLLVQGVTATWTSGARAETASTLRLCNGPEMQYKFHVSLKRPKDVPGLDVDLRVAAMVIQQRLDAATLREKQRIVQEQEALKAWAEAAGALGYLLGSQ